MIKVSGRPAKNSFVRRALVAGVLGGAALAGSFQNVRPAHAAPAANTKSLEALLKEAKLAYADRGKG
ncbi:MAG TPA: hypothetical protein VF719_01690, partial [Abditibacteriaceae bacterium]